MKETYGERLERMYREEVRYILWNDLEVDQHGMITSKSLKEVEDKLVKMLLDAEG